MQHSNISKTDRLQGTVRGDSDKAVAELRTLRRNGPWTIAAISREGGAPVVRTFKGAIEVSRMRDWIHKRNGVTNLYWTINPTRQRMTIKPAKVNIARFDFAHVEADPIDGETAAAAKIRHRKAFKSGKVPAPWKVYESGNGVVALWKIKTPIPIKGEAMVAKVEAVNIGLKEALGGKAAGYDDCHNLDRLLRLPHTVNLPDAKKRSKGRVIELAGNVEANPAGVYELSDLPVATEAATADKPAFKIGTPVTVEDLDALPISDRIKEIINDGRVEGETKPRDDTDSAWRYEAECAMLRARIDPEQILGILTDKTYAISDRALRAGNAKAAERYARKEIARAQDDVTKGKTKELADDFAEDAPSIADDDDDIPPTNDVAAFEAWLKTPDELKPNPLKAMTLSQIRAMPPVKYLVAGWIAENALFELFGKYNAGKTFFAVSVGCSIATGRPIFERKVIQGRVLYIVGEGGMKQFGNRVEAWLKDTAGDDEQLRAALDAQVESNFHMLPVAIHIDVQAQVDAFLKANPGRWSLVVIDTLMRNFSGNVSEQADMAKFVHGCDVIRGKTKAAVMALHHPGNAIKDRGMGSVNLPAATDGIGELRATGDGSKKQFEITKLREGAVHEQKILDLIIESVMLAPAGDDLDDFDSEELTPPVVSGVMRYVGTVNKPTPYKRTPRDEWLMTIADVKPTKSEELCKAWGVAKATASRRVADLRKAKLISAASLKLTPSGETQIAALTPMDDDDEDSFFG